MDNWRSRPGESNPAYLHGHTQGKFSPEYHTWSGMIQRCTNPNREAWKYYGGRGITVCKRWQKFENFLADMGPRPPGTTLDRKDVDGNYEPSNCRWATQEEQAFNKRPRDAKANHRALVLDALSVFPMKVSDLAHAVGIHPELVRNALRVLRAAGEVTTRRVPGTPGSRGRTYLCALAEDTNG